jgi:hypothetical protein
MQHQEEAVPQRPIIHKEIGLKHLEKLEISFNMAQLP